MTVPFTEIAVLGAVQGLTEFLPVSSDGHLALTQALFGIQGGNLALSVTLHAGTLLATLIYFRARLVELARASFAALGKGAWAEFTEPPARDVMVVVLASVPTAIIGLGLKDAVEKWTASPVVVALGFLATAGVLLSTRFAQVAKTRDPSFLAALLIGLAQGCAVAPGLSRSASTIAVALWVGVKAERAFELSMLISLPAILGAVVLELPEALAGQVPAVLLAAGATIAFVVGLAALTLLRRIVISNRFSWFAWWVVPMAGLAFFTAHSWPVAK